MEKEMKMEIMTEKEFLETSEMISFGINFNGVAIPGYMSHAQALANGMTHTAKNTVTRNYDCFYAYPHYGEDNYKYATASSLSLMNTGIWNDGYFTVKYPVENGNYRVCFLVVENYQDYFRTFLIAVPGKSIGVPRMRKGEFTWIYTDYEVSNGSLDFGLNPGLSGTREVHIMAMAATKQ
ncbi:MAG: hypothetical protein GY729_13700 [Desulfobacteraceae bacterium]|nr:hypothetical protein [Desulfobacteraceae bacterium]